MNRSMQDLRNYQNYFVDEKRALEFEIERPHNCGRLYQFLISYKFRAALGLLDQPLNGRSLLEVCSGSGLMAEKFAREGARVTVSDFSVAAVQRARERARRHGFMASFAVADAQRLPFADASFDVVAVHEGLHNLEQPELALREMARVAAQALIVMEPADATLTAWAGELGLSVKRPEGGIEIKRLSPGKVATLLSAQAFARIKWQRALVYDPHVPFKWFSWFDNRAVFAIFRVGFALANLVAGAAGNKLTLVAQR
ncbi:MAG TPA: class I SAM-dependent methyltransferase [Candidatus Binataceae bacterium]|nr:class I SAM-dependent methyltransferase [Candidatus Binataceae bacterium]